MFCHPRFIIKRRANHNAGYAHVTYSFLQTGATKKGVFSMKKFKSMKIIFLFFFLFVPYKAMAAYEVVSHGVNNYDDNPCPGEDISYSDIYTTIVYDCADTSCWDYPYNYRYMNTSVDPRDFADTDTFAWGRDSTAQYGTDFADVIYFAGHGGTNCAGRPDTERSPQDQA